MVCTTENCCARRRRDRARLVAKIAVFGLICFAATATIAADPSAELRERFLGADGLPSEAAYQSARGILPVADTETFHWQVVFKVAYRSADVADVASAKALHADCYFVRTRKYAARKRVQPVWDGRASQANGRIEVVAYTDERERLFGYIYEHCQVVHMADAQGTVRMPDLAGAEYNPFTGQLWRARPGGEIEEPQRLYLPFAFGDAQGRRIEPEFKIVQAKGGSFSLLVSGGKRELTLATCAVAGSKDRQRTDGYAPGGGPGYVANNLEPTTIIELPGTMNSELLDTRGAQLVLRSELIAGESKKPAVQIDGNFDEWRSVPGIGDPERDSVSYLQYNPDTDLLQFKVANDQEHLYFYTRVAGRHGNTAGERDRYYFYIYIDADRNPRTGYVPTRDDECYYGVTLGTDCEPQFEFIGGRLVKTFFGFAGSSTETDVLQGRVAFGPSWYNRHDEQGRLREGYKVEYTRRNGQTSITKDFSEGASDDITIAFSPDGSECEMRASLHGFLQGANGASIIAAGQRIDLAAGVEASGLIRGHTRWSADSTAVIRGYRIAK